MGSGSGGSGDCSQGSKGGGGGQVVGAQGSSGNAASSRGSGGGGSSSSSSRDSGACWFMQARRASPALAAAPGRAGHATGGRGEAGVGDVRRAVAQAMRYAGCPNRRSLGVSDVYPLAVVTRGAPRVYTLQAAGGVGSSWPAVGRPRQAAAASPLARACSGCRWGGLGRARRPGGGGTVCRARSTTLTGSNGAQGLWSEYTAKPQLAAVVCGDARHAARAYAAGSGGGR